MTDPQDFRVGLSGARRRVKRPPGTSIPVPTIIIPDLEGDDDLHVELRLSDEEAQNLKRLLAAGEKLTLRLE